MERLPDPAEFGESWEHPSATHGDFHHRPDFLGGNEQVAVTFAPMGLVELGEHGRMPGIRLVPPRSWSSGRPGGPPRFVVIHYTAGSEGPTAAEDGVAYDQRRYDGTSAHFYTDRDSIIQCVDTDHRSHTALYHGNLWGIHIEQCGTVQSRAQWLDAASRATIRNTAKVAAWALTQYGLPLTRLVNGAVRSGKGMCGHIDCTNGFPEDGGTHTDPGTAYPWDVLISDIRAELDGTQEDDMVDATTRTIMPQGPFPTDSGARPDITVFDATTIGLRNAEYAAKGVDDIKAQLAQPTPVTLTEEQMEQLAARLAALVPTAEQIAVAVADEDHRRSAG